MNEDFEEGVNDGGAAAELRTTKPPDNNLVQQQQQQQQRLHQRQQGFPRTAPRPVDKFLLSSDEESDSPHDDDDDDDDDDALAWKRKKEKNGCRGEEEEDHPREFLEAWQQQKAKDRRQSDSRRPTNENGDSVKNILQSPSRSPRDIRLPGHTPSNSPKMKRKKNNIWGAVVEDQVLEQGMQQSIGLFEKPEDGEERGVESYNFERAKDDTRVFAVPETRGGSSQDEMFQVRSDANDPFQKILEAEGLKSKENDDDDDDDDDEGKSSNDDEDDDDEEEELEASAGAVVVDEEVGELEETKEKRANRKRRRDDPRRRRNNHGQRRRDNRRNDHRDNNRRNDHNIHVKDRLGPREWDVTMTCDENDDEDRVIDVIQNRLKEPKRHLVASVVSVMGNAFALKVLTKTETIEEAGGIPTADNCRRRTPGGVFMQLIKTEDSLTKEQRKKIFEDDRRLYNKKQKEMRKLKFAQRNQWKRRNEAEAGKLAAAWKGDMKEEEEEEEEEKEKKPGGEEAMEAAEKGAVAGVAASSSASLANRLSSIDDEFVDDEFGDDVDAVKDDVVSGFGGAELPRDRRRTPSPIEDLF